MESPFLIHKSILLNDYGGARTLRSITLSLWNGKNWPVDMSRVNGLDEKHFAIAIALISWYRQYGEDDPDFMDTGRQCEAIELEAKKKAEQNKAYDNWERLVDQALRARGKSETLTFDNYEWFFPKFEKGLTPTEAAEQAILHGLK